MPDKEPVTVLDTLADQSGRKHWFDTRTPLANVVKTLEATYPELGKLTVIVSPVGKGQSVRKEGPR